MANSGSLNLGLHWKNGVLSVGAEMPERERTTRSYLKNSFSTK